jgi:hypothetical protein
MHQSPHGAATCPAYPGITINHNLCPNNTRSYHHSVDLHPTKQRVETAYISMCSVS